MDDLFKNVQEMAALHNIIIVPPRSITRGPQDTVAINPTKRDPDAEVTLRILKPRNHERKGDSVILLPSSTNHEL